MKVKINIPDNCEMVQEGNTYIVKEKQKSQPKTWEEFCKNYPVRKNECYISPASDIRYMRKEGERSCNVDRNLCSSKEEAEAFLALIQLRRLRNTWVENMHPNAFWYSICFKNEGFIIEQFQLCPNFLSFPSITMAYDFINCFRDLLQKTKILL